MMGVKSDSWIRERALAGMIEPFVDRQESEVDGRRVISYGLSSYGYDMRLADEFQIFHNLHSSIVDPKDFRAPMMCWKQTSQTVIIPPNSYMLGRSLEWFRIPRDVLGLCVGKSSYARCGIGVNVTPLEPGWEGNVTIEIANHAPVPALVYANEGIAQVIFLGADRFIDFELVEAGVHPVCEVSYADRKGKYQGQAGITLPKV